MEQKLSEAEVLLVTMPFCDEYMPCLTFALFKSILAKVGIKSRMQHEFLYFANRIGLEKYRGIMKVCTIGYGHDYFACETIFADAAHDGGPIRSFEEYIRWMEQEHLPGKAFAANQQQDTLRKLGLFREARDMTGAYLEEAAARVRESGAKVVAFLSMYQQHNATIALAKRLKREKNPPFSWWAVQTAKEMQDRLSPSISICLIMYSRERRTRFLRRFAHGSCRREESRMRSCPTVW